MIFISGDLLVVTPSGREAKPPPAFEYLCIATIDLISLLDDRRLVYPHRASTIRMPETTTARFRSKNDEIELHGESLFALF